MIRVLLVSTILIISGPVFAFGGGHGWGGGFHGGGWHGGGFHGGWGGHGWHGDDFHGDWGGHGWHGGGWGARIVPGVCPWWDGIQYRYDCY